MADAGIDQGGELVGGFLGVFRARIISGKEFAWNDPVGAGEGNIGNDSFHVHLRFDSVKKKGAGDGSVDQEKSEDSNRVLVIESKLGTNLLIGALFKFLATLEEWKLLGFDCHIFTGLGIPAGVAFVVFDKKAA